MTTTVPIAPTVTLHGGAEMPVVALGTWPMNDEETAVAVESALLAGYRHIDTAEAYENERGVGEGLRRSGIPREEVFITTKFNQPWHSVEGAAQAFANSTERLGIDTIDLFMVHWPIPWEDNYVAAVQGLVKLRDAGKIRAIGVSNFEIEHLERLFEHDLVPEVVQLQLEPEHVWPARQRFHREHGIQTVAYSPLGRGGSFLEADAIQAAAAAHGRTPSQVALRWNVQQGNGVAPKSGNPERQRENLNIFDFELSDAEMAEISALDTGEQQRRDPKDFGH